MEINWIIIAIAGVCVIIIVAFLIWKNEKDKKELTKFLNNEYKKEDESELNNDD